MIPDHTNNSYLMQLNVIPKESLIFHFTAAHCDMRPLRIYLFYHSVSVLSTK